jgi:hypothetical protein
MKTLILILFIFSQSVISQVAKKELRNNQNQPPTHIVSEKTKARMQIGNKQNDKYIEKYRYQNNNQTIICESERGRRNHCAINTRYGVNFVRQLSNSSCNLHWGYDQSGIWVDSGCRAEFSVNYGWDQAGSEGNIMVCNSQGFNRNYCPAYLNGRDVFLLRQNSQSTCVNNWGYDRNGVWVTNGCRAEFVVEDRNYNFGNDIVICSSRNLRFQGCQADTRGGVEFVRQLSRNSCNGNWGYDRQGIWVTNGCRAKFKLIPYINNNYGSQRTLVNCSSKNHRRKICPANTSGGVRLKKRKSRTSCQNNWGYGQDHIWVDNGCRATFELNVNGNNYGNNYGNTGQGQNNNYGNNQNNNGYGNRQNNIICESVNSQRRTCRIPQGSKVKFQRQLSRSSCNGAWGYNRNEIWVANGCKAEFSVY